MAAHQVVALQMLVTQIEEVTDLKAEPILDFIWLVSCCLPSRTEQNIGRINPDDIVSESCQRNRLRPLSTTSVENSEVLLCRGQV